MSLLIEAFNLLQMLDPEVDFMDIVREAEADAECVRLDNAKLAILICLAGLLFRIQLQQ